MLRRALAIITVVTILHTPGSAQQKTFNVFSGSSFTAVFGNQNNYYQPTEVLKQVNLKLDRILTKFEQIQKSMDTPKKPDVARGRNNFLEQIKNDSLEISKKDMLIDSLMLTVKTKNKDLEEAKGLVAQSQAVTKSSKYIADTKTLFTIEQDHQKIYSFKKSEIESDQDLISVYGSKNNTSTYVVKKFNRYGFIDRFGNLIIGFKYEYAENFENALALVEQGGKFGFVSTNDEEVIPIKYDLALSFREKKAVVLLKNNWFFINTKGNAAGKIKKFSKDTITNVKYIQNASRIILHTKNDFEYLLNKDGAFIWNFDPQGPLSWWIANHYKKIYDIGYSTIYKVRLANGNFALINDRAKVISNEYTGDFNFDLNNYAVVGKNIKGVGTRYNLIDTNGVERLNQNYTQIDSFKFGAYPVQSDKQYWGLLDVSLKEKVKCEYDEVKQLADRVTLVLNSEYISNKSVKKYGVVDENGFSFIPVYFSKIEFVDNKSFFVSYGTPVQTSELNLIEFNKTIIAKCVTNCENYKKYLQSPH